jgi:hypothetical protein
MASFVLAVGVEVWDSHIRSAVSRSEGKDSITPVS